MRFPLLATFALVAAGVVFGQDLPKGPSPGDKAIDFTLPYATKDSVGSEDLRLSSLIGKQNIVLAFYPADWSGGCTKEVCTLRDNFEALSGLDAMVLGISGDYEYSHREWAKFHNLPFRLVSDHKNETARAYGSFNSESGFNRRTVFVVDKSGKIAYTDMKYSAGDIASFNKLKDALAKLK